jgi:uncharacterized protein (DUF362 family)
MKKITRREFLKIGAGITIAGALPSSLFNPLHAQSAKSVISVARGDPANLVKAAIDGLGGISSFVKPGDIVCIKPNISFAANIECGATTSPAIVKHMVTLCLEADAKKVILVDHTIANATLCIERSQIEQAIIDKNTVEFIPLSTEEMFKETLLPNGQELSMILTAKILDQADVLINMPTAKSHSQTGISLGMKNLMGLIWDRAQLHRVNLHRAITDLATAIKPDLILVDATRALVTGGPGGPGKTVTLNTIVAGTDQVAVDSYTVGLTPWYDRSFTGQDVKYIVAGHERGLGEIDVTRMDIKEFKV